MTRWIQQVAVSYLAVPKAYSVPGHIAIFPGVEQHLSLLDTEVTLLDLLLNLDELRLTPAAHGASGENLVWEN